MARERLGDLVEALDAGGGIVCLAGAGGKKSTIYRVVSGFSGRVAITSTVHTPPFRKRLVAEIVVAPKDELMTRLARASDSRVVAYACPSDKKARLAGVDPALVARIHESCRFDLTLVKADGARLRWIKAPGPHEPALPPRCTTLIALASVRAVGERLDPLVAHRPELIAGLAGMRMGERITPRHIARLLAHPEAGMKHAARADRVVPVVNMVDGDEQRHAARVIAEELLTGSALPDRVVLTRMTSEQPVVEVIRR